MVLPPRRVLVTGATGNVGTALLRRLAREGVAVSGVARRTPSPESTLPPAERSPAAPVRWHGIDLSAAWATGALREAMEDADAVVHLAWRLQPSRTPADRAGLRAVNVNGTRAVVEAARSAGVPHLVHASSTGVYAPVPDPLRKQPVDESWPRTGVPTSAYSRDKVAAEDLLNAVEAEGRHGPGGPAVARVRPGLVLQRAAGAEIARYFGGPFLPASLLGGAGRRRTRVLPVLPLPEEFVVPVVHADDLADALWHLLAAGPEHATGAFNVAADDALGPVAIAEGLGARRRVGAPVSLLRSAADASWRARLQPTDPGWVDLAAGTPLLDCSRLKALGWRPTTTARAALDDLVAGMRAGDGGGTPVLAPRGALHGRIAV
ncbi:Nucleoside-diphosphate-sugar epimerase [Quadrisphaera granulorum]|uniref:Nucleoside-diphosphate-sugar epimerase n=1 Tax=Quadrisphaera granulorum TaxID=317664 RepID=A0A316AAT5_9ACTN|nr:NAD-dependent epimerase/dehydratase family protein [Quadrisphaera granulorum]PWJ54672.1 nucleoside-diphosphate-sugar epimerase [Quadrisphaera granulorum]SZE96034.1 Nucleoside-diphosphate-sugar epimerase [Quadrisphaera granulorum]